VSHPADRGAFAAEPIERVAAYWNTRPCNIRHSPRPVGTRDYFDEVEARKYRVEPHIPGFAEFARWNGKKVLEIGCGIGTDTINFARAGAHVTAVDLTENALEVARQRARVFGLEDRIRFVQANAEELNRVLPPEPFDLVYSFGVLHHTPHPDAALEQLRAYMAPHTSVRIMVYHRWSWKVFWIWCTQAGSRRWDLDRIVAEHSEAQTGCPVTYTYSRSSARRWLERHGIGVNRVFADHVFPYSIEEYTRYEYKKVWYFRWMPAPLFRWFERAFGWHLCLIGTPAAAAPRPVPSPPAPPPEPAAGPAPPAEIGR